MYGWAFAPELTQKNTLPCRELPLSGLRRFDYRLIHQQDGDAVPDGIYPPALAALQAFPFMLQDQALFAYRADQNFQQLWGDHGEMILLLVEGKLVSDEDKSHTGFPNRIQGACRVS